MLPDEASHENCKIVSSRDFTSLASHQTQVRGGGASCTSSYQSLCREEEKAFVLVFGGENYVKAPQFGSRPTLSLRPLACRDERKSSVDELIGSNPCAPVLHNTIFWGIPKEPQHLSFLVPY